MVTNLSAGVDAFTSNAFLVPGERPVLVDTGANYDVVSRIRRHVVTSTPSSSRTPTRTTSATWRS